MKKCLFICYGGGHVNTIIPVIKVLSSYTDINIKTIGINLAAETLRRNGIPCNTLSDYLTKETIKLGLPIAETRHNFESIVSFADSIAYYGFSMRDLIHSKGAKLANKILNVYDRRLFLPIYTMKEIISKEKPDVVVATTMHRFEAAALIAANEMGIPSLRIEDLLGNISKPFPDKIRVNTISEKQALIRKGIKYDKIVTTSQLEDKDIAKIAKEVYEIYYHLQPTKISVLCKFAKKNIEKRGLDPESIVITGQPAFDELITFNNIDKNYICKKLGLDNHKQIISFMSQPIDSREKVLRALVRALEKYKDIQLIIKLHPNEDGRLQEIILNEARYKAFVIKDIPAPMIISISDLVMTVSSTTGLEAVIMNKPLISINLTGMPDFIPYCEMGIGLGVYAEDDISSKIMKILEDREIRSMLEIARAEFRTDGKAASRVAELILKMSR